MCRKAREVNSTKACITNDKTTKEVHSAKAYIMNDKTSHWILLTGVTLVSYKC
jgi:hypothetical protein